MAIRTIPGGVVLVVVVLLLSTPTGPVEAQSNSTNLSLTIQGQPSMYSTPALDLCGLVHLGSCAIDFNVAENFHQSVPISFVTDRTVLQTGDSVTVTANPGPATPSAALDFTLTFSGHSYTYSYQLSSLPTVGSSTLLSIPIPVGAVTTALGLPPLPITLNFNLLVSSDLTGSLSGSGFSGTSSLSWSSISSQQSSMTFLGGVDVATLNFDSFKAIQNWRIALSAGVPLVGSVQLFNTTVSNLNIPSNDPQVFTWNHLAIDTQYSTGYGSGWYLTGSSATFGISGDTVSTGQSSRVVFTGWQGQGSGRYSGGQDSATVKIEGPITETAGWKTQYSVTIASSPGGMISPSPGTQWYDQGYQLVLQENPSNSYVFSGWVVNGATVSTSQSYTYSVNGPATISAQFSYQSPQTNPQTGGNSQSGSSRGTGLVLPFDIASLIMGLAIGGGVAVVVLLIRRKK